MHKDKYMLIVATMQDVVHLIRSNPLRTELLVASESVDDWYKEHNKAFSFEYCDRCVM